MGGRIRVDSGRSRPRSHVSACPAPSVDVPSEMAAAVLFVRSCRHACADGHVRTGAHDVFSTAAHADARGLRRVRTGSGRWRITQRAAQLGAGTQSRLDPHKALFPGGPLYLTDLTAVPVKL